MKLSKGTVLGVILLLVLAIGAYGLITGSGSNFRSKSGFRGLKWGAPPSEHEYVKPSDFILDFGNKYFNVYYVRGDKNSFGDVRLSAVSYSFLIDNGVEKFESVTLTLRSAMGDRESRDRLVLDILTKEYGQYSEEGDSAENKEYIFENDYVTVSYWDGGLYYKAKIKIASKEMRSRFSKIYEKAEAEKRQKAADL